MVTQAKLTPEPIDWTTPRTWDEWDAVFEEREAAAKEFDEAIARGGNPGGRCLSDESPATRMIRHIAGLGYPVFPLLPGLKRPLRNSNGCKDATTYDHQIRNWAASNPGCNWAVATAGLLVLDVDLLNGEQNPWLTPERHERLAGVPYQTTPSGGLQYFFRDPGRVEDGGEKNACGEPIPGGSLGLSASKIAEGIDTRAIGGYVAVAPSYLEPYTKGGRTYQGGYAFGPSRRDELPPLAELPVAPEWLIAELEAAEAAKTRREAQQPAAAGDAGRSDYRDRVLAAAEERGWVDVLANVAGIPVEVLDGRHHPCPKPECGGTDRFRFMAEHNKGGVICNQCFSSENGDVLSAVAWMKGLDIRSDFKKVLRLVGDYLGVEPPATPARSTGVLGGCQETDAVTAARAELTQIVRQVAGPKGDMAAGLCQRLVDAARARRIGGGDRDEILAYIHAGKLNVAEGGVSIPDAAVERIVEILVAVPPADLLPAPLDVQRYIPGEASLLRVAAGKAVTLDDGVELTEAQAAEYNRLVDIGVLLRLHEKPNETVEEIVRKRAAEEPREGHATLPDTVVDMIVGKVLAASVHDLDRTFEAANSPKAETDRLKAEVERAEVRAKAERFNIPIPGEEGGHGVDMTSYLDWVEQDFAVDYHVRDLIVRGQPGFLVGPPKTLKTTLSAAIAVHGATGTNVFGLEKFAVPKKFRTGIISMESGAATLKRAIESVRESIGASRADIGDRLHLKTERQKINHPHSIADIRRRIDGEGIDLLLIDPFSDAVGLTPDAMKSITEMYASLRPFGELVDATGCTILLVHHTLKGKARNFARTELADINGAGLDAWARQWLLLNRRSAYDPVAAYGRHELHIHFGGSAGHSGGLDLDVEEFDVEGKPKWSVTATKPEPAAAKVVLTPEDKALRKERAARQARKEKGDDVLLALIKAGEPLTVRSLRERTGGSPETVGAATYAYVNDGLIQIAGKSKQKADLFEPTEKGRLYSSITAN